MPRARSEASSDEPHDPLIPRPDDPWIGRWWWARPLYRRRSGRPVFFRWPIALTLMLVVFALVALGVYSLLRAA